MSITAPTSGRIYLVLARHAGICPSLTSLLGVPAEYVIDEQRERHVSEVDDAGIAAAIRDAVNGVSQERSKHGPSLMGRAAARRVVTALSQPVRDGRDTAETCLERLRWLAAVRSHRDICRSAIVGLRATRFMCPVCVVV